MSEAAASNLPRWDLSDLYPGPQSEELKRDLDRAGRDAIAFEDKHAGRVASLDGGSFANAIGDYERITEILHRIFSYAQLLHASDVSNPDIGRFYQDIQEKGTEISAHLIFFTLEINRIDDSKLEEMLKVPDAARYAPWIRDIRAFRAHQLSDELEKMLHEKEVAGRGSFVRLFDETMASLRFPVNGEDLTITQVTDRLSSREPEKRKAAAKVMGTVLGDNMRLFSLITNTLAKDKEIEDRWRGYARPVSSRNLANQVEDEVVDALVTAVKGSYGDLSHRYYRLKARWMGMEKLDYWDRNAPLPEDTDRTYSWDEARETVLSAYSRFSPELADIGRKFFDNPWIDVPARPGKASGAFAHPTVPSVHPYLLLNFMGRGRDVMTLAHELGHGCHQVLAGEQGPLLSATPLTLAETASVFGEMMTFRSMVDAETDATRRRVMLAGKVEDMLNTVVRQIAFHEFERHVHDERRNGELSEERLGEIWMQCQRESLGDAFRFDDEYKNYWAYIPHFIHSPFYVYAYAFGDCLVNALYSVFLEGHEGFQKKYLDMLRAGGTKTHKDLLAPFGLDASDPAFWKRGLTVISGFIDELEEVS
ncbi:Oligoendopeptidase F [Caenispirillum salinarum AK4]|uniref:Oligoendopeptidase F n=1 Tax=Caenispirillum salinarum AK4 TaxID=1238182 RepID=K9HMK5_9PROT|nr:M3 family oligoendopeptidase [Caenispirillum salinarum]EKV31548.1 Oligoendopeptidase F [Caenispirillum salinarum AK4]